MVHSARRSRAGGGAGAGGGRSVLAALQAAPEAPRAGPGAAAAYLGASRYVAGARIDTALFHPLALRSHRGTTDVRRLPGALSDLSATDLMCAMITETAAVGSGAARVDWAAKYLR